MVKIIGPMHSDDARGQFAKSVVFIGWRGIKDARMWKKPANPKTAAQQTQRGYFTSAVGQWHNLNASDLAPWGTRAAGNPYSGFNLFVSRWIDFLVAGYTPTLISSVSASAGTTKVKVIGKLSQSVSVRVKMGTTAGTWTIQTDDPSPDASFTTTTTGLSSGVKYYYTVESLTTSKNGEYGWGTFTTA